MNVETNDACKTHSQNICTQMSAPDPCFIIHFIFVYTNYFLLRSKSNNWLGIQNLKMLICRTWMIKKVGLRRFGEWCNSATNLVNPPSLKQTMSVYGLFAYWNFPYHFSYQWFTGRSEHEASRYEEHFRCRLQYTVESSGAIMLAGCATNFTCSFIPPVNIIWALRPEITK
jgi:hypothetical protein